MIKVRSRIAGRRLPWILHAVHFSHVAELVIDKVCALGWGRNVLSLFGIFMLSLSSFVPSEPTRTQPTSRHGVRTVTFQQSSWRAPAQPQVYVILLSLRSAPTLGVGWVWIRCQFRDFSTHTRTPGVDPRLTPSSRRKRAQWVGGTKIRPPLPAIEGAHRKIDLFSF
jgi:hypothetical protein